MFSPGGVDKVWFEGNSGDPHKHGSTEPTPLRHLQQS